MSLRTFFENYFSPKISRCILSDMTLHFDQRLLLLMPPYDTIIKITGALKLTNSSSENQLISLTFFLLQMSQYNTIAKINLLNQLVPLEIS